MTIQELAGSATDPMTTQQRGDETITVRTDDAPAWVADVIQEAHGDMFPDDYRYETIRDAFETIAADDDDPEDSAAEFADNTDVYNSDLLAWVGSHGDRAGYVDEAIGEFGPARDFYHGLMMGQYAERSEVYGLVLQALERIADDSEEVTS